MLRVKDTKLTGNRFTLTYASHAKSHVTVLKVRTTCLMREINSIYAIKDSRRRCCREASFSHVVEPGAAS